MVTTISEFLWTRLLLNEIDINLVAPTPHFCDNESVHQIVHTPVFHEFTKHIEMDCYFVGEYVESKDITPVRIKIQDQLVDLLTKPLNSDRLKLLSVKLGIQNLHSLA